MSTKQLQGGKKPLSAKPKASSFMAPDFFTNKLSISQELHDEITAKGMEYRFINYKKYLESGNQHDRGWVVYKRDKVEGLDTFALGNSPDNTVRRGDCILAVRPKHLCEQHRQWLKTRADAQAGISKARADEFRQYAKENRLDISVSEGYEDDSE